MIEIKSINNKGIIKVDDEDFEMLSQYKWRISKGYVRTTIKIYGKWKNIFMHRLIMNTPKGMFTDHIDRNKLNNTKNNLRIVTSQQNNMNVQKRKNCSSKYKGIHWFKRDKKWQAQIMINNKHIYLGLFKNEIDAAIAYNNKAKELFGEYAYLNNIEELK